jgi:hypothetical protein
MTFDEFRVQVEGREGVVVLLEGRREIPDAWASRATTLGRLLARRFPQAVFRSGNATGSDEAFATGVAMVDPARLQLVLPTRTHGRSRRPEGATAVALNTVPDALRDEMVAVSAAVAGPDNRRLFLRDSLPPALATKRDYLLRDALKVIGGVEGAKEPVTVALFYVDADNPAAGGTGHTIRVCRERGVPVVLQSEWGAWIEQLQPPGAGPDVRYDRPPPSGD